MLSGGGASGGLVGSLNEVWPVKRAPVGHRIVALEQHDFIALRGK